MYLLATYYQRPRYPHLTVIKGWNKDPKNVIADEHVTFKTRINDRDTTRHNVVLDLVNKRVVKCSVGGNVGTDYDTVYKHFAENYPQYFQHFDQLDQSVESDVASENNAESHPAPQESFKDS